MNNDSSLSPLMQQYMSIKNEHKGEVLFFRLGDFYEMFFEDALEVSRLLNLTLTHRGDAPMCGIPFHASKIYIARLLRLGKKIALCEQIGDPKAKGLTERKVVEIITPGTVLETEYLEGTSNNFLASLCVFHGMAGFAFIDISTASFKATSWHSSEMTENFAKELGRASPREILLPNSLKNNEAIQASLSEIPFMSVSYYPDWNFNAEAAFTTLCRQFKTVSLKSFGLDEKSAEVPAAGFLLDYLSKTTHAEIPHISSISVYHDSQYLIIDESSRRNLEIVSNLRDSSSHFSLLECVNCASTAMGSRMIRQWLLFPLTEKKKIEARQNHVSLFAENRALMESVRKKLSSVLDIERLAGRIAMQKAHAKDLQALKSSLIAWIDVQNELNEFDFAAFDEQKSVEIIDLIQNSILDDPGTIITDGGMIKQGWSEELDHWRNISENFDSILYNYERELKDSTGISNLKIKYTNSSGYFIEVSRGKLSSVPANFIMRRSLTNGDRFTTERLQDLEHELNEASVKVLELEKNLFIEIRTKLSNYIPYLLQTADEIAYTDAASSFANAACIYGWIKPAIFEDGRFIVVEGRHPVVEMHIPSGEFVPNSLNISSDEETPSFAIITGPNMAGKSTFLRQNALIALMAQAGSFVPATKAEIGLVDRIFCRVGASDNLARGESTFLVEMTETAHIIRSATQKSLVIMDEVGRGTSTEDGLSIAWAVSEHFLNNVKCRALFATHYHELTRIEHKRLTLLCMEVSEQNGSVTFLRKVKNGASENSYGIHVAQLAGIPKAIIDRANEVLEHIQGIAENRPVLNSIQNTCEKNDNLQNEHAKISLPNLFSDEEIVLDEILSCDLDNITPLQALQSISRWKKTLMSQ
ncbi:MAG: DNA mismatch repair protein MutS [Treponema sp.]|nr:DNA mismatch repair protein MutS [Treponema sp.]